MEWIMTTGIVVFRANKALRVGLSYENKCQLIYGTSLAYFFLFFLLGQLW